MTLAKNLSIHVPPENAYSLEVPYIHARCFFSNFSAKGDPQQINLLPGAG
jgi:hypothetical protein